jgi:hypothetical protein
MMKLHRKKSRGDFAAFYTASLSSARVR